MTYSTCQSITTCNDKKFKRSRYSDITSDGKVTTNGKRFTMIKKFSQWTRGIGPPCLFTIHCIKSLGMTTLKHLVLVNWKQILLNKSCTIKHILQYKFVLIKDNDMPGFQFYISLSLSLKPQKQSLPTHPSPPSLFFLFHFPPPPKDKNIIQDSSA